MTTGFMARAQAQAATLVRTAIANAVNTARLASFAEEGVQTIEWVSVIDVTFDVGSHSLGVLRAANVPHGARSVFPCDSHVFEAAKLVPMLASADLAPNEDKLSTNPLSRWTGSDQAF